MESPTPRIWVLPNRRTPGFVAVLVGIWYAGASQGNAAAYLLCFTLAAMALVSLVHTWGNLRGLELSVEKVTPAFAGEDLPIALKLRSSRRHAHFAVAIITSPQGAVIKILAIDATAETRATCLLPTKTRGCFPTLSFHLSSSFPLGFFTAQRRLTIAHPHHVYPATDGDLPLPRMPQSARQAVAGLRAEGEDYGGVRAWQVGESQRHIDWKAAARGQPLLTKQWAGDAAGILVFDYQTMPIGDSEMRLRQLTKWVVLAERGAEVYTLRLPAKVCGPGRGDSHFHACLRALAEFSPA